MIKGQRARHGFLLRCERSVPASCWSTTLPPSRGARSRSTTSKDTDADARRHTSVHNRHSRGGRPEHPPPRAATDLAWLSEPPNSIAQAVPTHDMFVTVGLALGGIR